MFKLNPDSLLIPSAKAAAPSVSVVTTFPLNSDQEAAVSAAVDFLHTPDAHYFLLQGPAGTGKTFCIKALINRIRGRLVFTAPTNKATKVLRESVEAPGYRPEARTIFSLLGLRLEANGEVKELAAPEDPIDLTIYAAVVVDEASMVSSALWEHIQWAAENQGIKFIFMGDVNQIPPVGEIRSKLFSMGFPGAELTKVMRHDNQILKFATHLRQKLAHPAPSCTIESDNDGQEGLWKMGRPDFLARMLEYIDAGWFTRPDGAKAIAWRNATVDQINQFVRKRLFGDGAATWLPGDRIVMTAPGYDENGKPYFSTDDEGEVTKVNVTWNNDYPEYKCYALTVTLDDNRVVTVWLLHEDSARDFNRNVERLAAEARSNSKLWEKVWDFKEAFHSAKYAYAITGHRAQGSTYQYVFVDFRDILLNRNRHEAFRILYVAATRPKKRLYLA